MEVVVICLFVVSRLILVVCAFCVECCLLSLGLLIGVFVCCLKRVVRLFVRVLCCLLIGVCCSLFTFCSSFVCARIVISCSCVASCSLVVSSCVFLVVR